MFEVLVWGTFIYLIWAMGQAYARSKDALHPMLILGPLLLYAYVIRTLWMNELGILDTLFTKPGQLDLAQTIHTSGIFAFTTGILGTRVPSAAESRARPMSDWQRQKLSKLGLTMGMAGVIAYAYMIARRGGFLNVYGEAKGYLGAGSGYISDLPLLVYPSILILSYAWKGQPWTGQRLLLIGLLVSPNLIHGTIGSRRGPLFISLAVIAFGYLATRSRRPSLPRVMGAVGLIGAAVLFVWAFRFQLYLGSNFDLDDDRYAEVLTGADTQFDDPFVSSAGLINVAQATNTTNWGLRYFTVIVIRPIPRQLWPDKYKDIGYFDRGDRRTENRRWDIPEQDWMENLGWCPTEGASVGMIGDLFLEFSYFGLIGCYFVGRFYGRLWRRARTEQGVWLIIYLYALGLSVYIPTQGLASAWFFRLAFASIPTYVLWQRAMRSAQPRRQRILAEPAMH